MISILEKYRKNKYVKDIQAGKLVYTKQFYIDLLAFLNNNFTAVEAYQHLGFDVAELGEDRAKSAASRARKGDFYSCSFYVAKLDGTTMLKEYDNLTMAQELEITRIHADYFRLMYNFDLKYEKDKKKFSK